MTTNLHLMSLDRLLQFVVLRPVPLIHVHWVAHHGLLGAVTLILPKSQLYLVDQSVEHRSDYAHKAAQVLVVLQLLLDRLQVRFRLDEPFQLTQNLLQQVFQTALDLTFWYATH